MNLPHTKHNLLLSLLFKQYLIGNSSHLPDISKSQETFLWNTRLIARRLIVKHWETLPKSRTGCRQIQKIQHSSQLWEMTGPRNNSQEISSGKPLLMFKSIFAAAGNQPHKVQRDPRTAVGTRPVARACSALLSPSKLIGYASRRLLVTDKANVINLCMSFVISKQGQRATGSGWGVQAELGQCPLSRNNAVWSTEEQMETPAPNVLQGLILAVPAQRSAWFQQTPVNPFSH